MYGPAIIPSLRKNTDGSWLFLATIVRILLTPAFLNSFDIAFSIALPTPCSRDSGSTDNANTQPQGADPNSHARTSPMMKPTA